MTSTWPAADLRIERGSMCDSGRALQLEPVNAVRAFDLDAHGRLRSPSHQSRFIFRPGLNTAKCVYSVGHNGSRTDDLTSFSACSCGFYVWHDTTRAGRFADADTGVVAAVEVEGKVDIGRFGARAEKLRVLGVVEPRESNPFIRIADFLSPAGSGIALVALAVGMFIGASRALAGPEAEQHQAIGALLLVFGITICVGGIITFVASCIELPAERAFKRNSMRGDKSMRAARIKLMRGLYPDIVVVRSQKELLRRFPVTGPFDVVRTPDTDPDFWEKP